MRPAVWIGEDKINLVSDLIDGENGRWRTELIWRNFIAHDADAILNIPLRRGGEDFWA
jgi:hypothetical protein